MVRGLAAEEDRQLLVGDGSGGDMIGLCNEPNLIPRPLGSDTLLDAIPAGINDLRTGPSYTEPDCVVCHPNDALQIRLSKDLQDRYIAAALFPCRLPTYGASAW
jgi:hypothetical protein